MSTDLLLTTIDRDFRAARAGDSAAYGRLVQATQRMVCGVALAHTQDRALAEDIAQDTFLRGWQRLGQMTSAESFLPWLRQVARNRAIDHLRSLRYREFGVEPDDPRWLNHSDDDTPERTLLEQEKRDWLAEALERVPDDTREVLLLYYLEGHDSAQVAALLGLGHANVRKRLQRARQALNAAFLERFAEAAEQAVPGPALLSGVLLAIGAGGAKTAQAGTVKLVAGGGAKLLGKGVLGALGTLAAGIGLVLAGVFVEVRCQLRRAAPERRRALIINGLLYASLMAGFIAGLRWARLHGWSAQQVLVLAVVVSVLVTLLSEHRRRLARRRSGPD